MDEVHEIKIIGAGVTGLSTGVALLEAGYRVEILSENFTPNLTSDRAAAIWFPFLAEPQELVLRWSRETYLYLTSLLDDQASGIRMVPMKLYDKYKPTAVPWWVKGVPEISFKALPSEMLPSGYLGGFEVVVPLIETQLFMPWLMDHFRLKGGSIHQQKIESLETVSHKDSWVINCTGLGAKELTGDQLLYPVKGQLVKVRPKTRVSEVINNDDSPDNLAYIIPREDGVILGGTVEPHPENLMTSTESVQAIIDRCTALNPALIEAEIIESYAGLRPARATIRLEKDPGKNIIHNYGHGGSGYTVSRGCALEVLKIIELHQSLAL